MIPKFRFFHIAKKKMYEVLSIHLMTGMVEVEGGKYFLIPQDGFLMQSTGLFDKNGVEIFEGDVVTYRGDSYIVAKKDAAIGLALLRNKEITSFKPLVDDIVDFNKLEVIGNIHENTELVAG